MRTTRVLAFVAALFTVLAACSSGDDPTEAVDFNDADVTFAQDMIPHHQQATEMAVMAPARTENPDVLALAERIKAAQEPEIDTMNDWLEDWGIPAVDHSTMDHSAMPGMMSDSEMSALTDSTGAEFDQLFLAMMIAHHEGAIEMAETEQAEGENRDAIELAEKIAEDQAAEIAEMMALLQ